MTAHTSVHDEAHRRHQKLFELGLPTFGLLGAILAGLLALVAFVFLLAYWD
jgi:hypothetical protein